MRWGVDSRDREGEREKKEKEMKEEKHFLQFVGSSGPLLVIQWTTIFLSLPPQGSILNGVRLFKRS
jgi:hypothetical protein